MQTDTLVNLYLDEHVRIAQGFPVMDVVALVGLVVDSYEWDEDVFVFGNGGASSAAEHFASDLAMHPFVSDDKHQSKEIRRIRIHCLNESTGLITRIANDIGYEDVFVEQLKNYPLDESNLVIAFSNSGNSPNIIKALEYAKSWGVSTVLIGGRDGGKAKSIVDVSILVPGSSQFPGQTGANDNSFHIEDFQTSIAHMVTGLLKEEING